MTPPAVANHVPAPVACERLADLVPRFGGTLALRAEASRIDYALPAHATEEVRAFLATEADVNLEREYDAHLPGGRVYGSGHVLAPDGRSLARDVSLDFGKAWDEHWLLTYPKIKPPQPQPGRTAVIATALSGGYCHWLLEELPRLLTLNPRECDAIIGHGAADCQREALERHGFTGQLLAPTRQSHWACEDLVVPGLVGPAGYPTPAMVRLVETFTAPIGREHRGFGERIFISREQARRRRVTNEAALVAALRQRGFATLRLEELTWAEQIAAFRHARVIVAPHGAGLANLVFARPGTIVVEMFNREYVNGCFWRLAAVRGLDYRPVVPAAETPLGRALAANRLDLEADLDGVRAALAAG